MRWTAPESWHITLQFLGNATEEQFECLRARPGEVRSRAGSRAIGRTGMLRSRGRRCLLDVAATLGPGRASHKRVAAATSRCGFAAERHGRFTSAHPVGTDQGQNRKERGTAPRSPNRKSSTSRPRTPFAAREVQLYQSHLRAEGARLRGARAVPAHRPLRHSRDAPGTGILKIRQGEDAGFRVCA